ncbi:MAG: hypothetical protein WBB07_23605 [Mycobacterium sp.]
MAAAALGWLGTVGTFVAYLLVSRGRLHANSWRYGSLNVIGGTLAGVAAILYGAWFSVASNFVWAAIGFVTVAAAIAQKQPRELAPAACSCRGPQDPDRLFTLAAN